MAQITIYVDDEVLGMVKAATKAGDVSQSQWISDAIRQRAKKEWPQAVLDLAGAWPDFPTIEEIRKTYGGDIPREKL